MHAWTKQAWTYEVIKRNHRLMIVRIESGELIYSPPDFIVLSNRLPLKLLAERLTNGADRITAIAEFESSQMRKG